MRYVILVLLNLPIVFLAYLNIVTSYKLGKTDRSRLRQTLLLWTIILIALIGSFPIYNVLTDKPLLDSGELTLFDIVQTTAIIYLIYIINHQRQKIELSNSRFKELVQELSIKLSEK